jgi:hypothetical protein
MTPDWRFLAVPTHEDVQILDLRDYISKMIANSKIERDTKVSTGRVQHDPGSFCYGISTFGIDKIMIQQNGVKRVQVSKCALIN